MPDEKRRWRWLLVIGLMAATDVIIRFGTGFRMRAVATGEAVLFAVGALTLYLMRQRLPPSDRNRDRLLLSTTRS